MSDNDTILGKLSDAAANATERVKEALSTAPQETEAGDTAMASRDQASVPTTSSDNFKDRTQTSLSEDAHDMATAAERKTNEAIDRVKEAGQDISDRANRAYKDTKSAASDEADKARNATDDTKAALMDKAPGRDTQDPQLAEQYGINKGFDVARDYAEKTEDVLGPSA